MLTTVVAFGSNASSGLESVVGFAITASLAIFASLMILGLFVPAVVMRFHAWRSRGTIASVARDEGRSRGVWLGSLISVVSNRWFVVLPLILIVTGFAAWGWINVETRMDAEDAMDSRSDFVVSLDKFDEHAADKAGEPAFIYIEGDFTQHEALDAMKVTMAGMDDNRHVARSLIDPQKANPRAFLFDLLDAVIKEDYTREQIQVVSGIEITDLDGDLIPDTQEQLQAVYDYVTVNGVLKEENTPVYTPKHIEEFFIHGSSGVEKGATLITIGVPGTREQEVVKASAVELSEDMDAAMDNVDSIYSYGLTGEGYLRVEQFDAIANSMSRSLIIAVAAVLVLLLVVFRSFRYALVTIIPVLLVACWLYGFMYIADYPLNMMTATIAAISIGVGIDFSIHFTERFRQELKVSIDKKIALRETARTTGFALFSAALTTVVGFTVIAFAPMPMFAAFGVLAKE
jgi:predicted RND superfamily exporter protein